MAGHLAKKGGHIVTVYNRTAAKAEQWAKEFGGKHKPTPREAAEGREIVFCCVGNDDDLRSVVLGKDGAFAGMTSGAIFLYVADGMIFRDVRSVLALYGRPPMILSA